MAERHDHLLDGNVVTKRVNITAGTPHVLGRTINREVLFVGPDPAATANVLLRWNENDAVAAGLVILPTMPGMVLWRRLYGPLVTGPIFVDVSAGTVAVYIVEVVTPGCHCDEHVGAFDPLLPPSGV